MHERKGQTMLYPALIAVFCSLAPWLHANIDILKNGDVNGDGERDVTDALYSLNWLFLSGPAPVDIFCPVGPGQDPCDQDVEAAGISTVRAYDRTDLENKPEVGSCWLSRNSRGITLMFSTSEIPVGHAVTLWLVIFNNPTACAEGVGACRGVNGDPENPDVEGDILYVDGFIAGQGPQTFGAEVEVGGESDSYLVELRGKGTPSGLLNPMTAEFHVFVRSHGPAIEGLEDEMIRTFDGGCDPRLQLQVGEWPDAPGECAVLFAAIHVGIGS